MPAGGAFPGARVAEDTPCGIVPTEGLIRAAQRIFVGAFARPPPEKGLGSGPERAAAMMLETRPEVDRYGVKPKSIEESMPANDNEPAAGLISKLRRLAPLDSHDRHLLAALPFRLEEVPAGRVLVSEGSVIAHCCLLVDGYACRHKTSADGKRQIVSFHVAGDLLDVQHLMLERADHNVETITGGHVAWVPTERLRALALDRPNIGTALWRDALIDSSVFREWVLNVGRRGARTRIAHMLCEVGARVLAADVASEDNLLLPLTQEQIADATGLTAVHVNRMLRQLREAGALSVVARGVCIEDFDRLRAISSFDPAYLHAAA